MVENGRFRTTSERAHKECECWRNGSTSTLKTFCAKERAPEGFFTWTGNIYFFYVILCLSKLSPKIKNVFQIGTEDVGFVKGHNRVSSKTDFILPPGHRESATRKGHSRQASRTESIYTLRHNAPPSRLDQLIGFLLRKKAKSDPEIRTRTIVPNHIVPPRTFPNGPQNNKIRTTKYTLLTFLPKNLMEQFHRAANLYFIFIVLLNWVPSINAFGKEIAMIPVLFVLGVTGIKDLFEDRRRNASDKRINNSTCRVYNGYVYTMYFLFNFSISN